MEQLALIPRSAPRRRELALAATFSIFVVGALLMLGLESLFLYPAAVVATLVALVVIARPWLRLQGVTIARLSVDRLDIAVVVVVYAAVVALFKLAFGLFGVDRISGMFLSYGGGMLLGVAVPVIYTVLVRHRTFADIGVGLHNWKPTVAFGLVFAGTQFALTLWGYDLPKPVDWVPLLVGSLTVGIFESIFFRGFVIGTLERSFGALPAVIGSATLYGLYHVGYGMPLKECIFLIGLGVTYAVAYRIMQNVLILWPLLTPLGGFFNMLQGDEIAMPWLAILGFVDVIALMVAAFTVTRKIDRNRKLRAQSPSAEPHQAAA